MEDQLTLLDKYFKLYDDKNYQEKIYEYSYATIIDHFIEYAIYNYDNGKLPDQHIINKKFKKIVLEN